MYRWMTDHCFFLDLNIGFYLIQAKSPSQLWKLTYTTLFISWFNVIHDIQTIVYSSWRAVHLLARQNWAVEPLSLRASSPGTTLNLESLHELRLHKLDQPFGLQNFKKGLCTNIINIWKNFKFQNQFPIHCLELPHRTEQFCFINHNTSKKYILQVVEHSRQFEQDASGHRRGISTLQYW